MTTVCVVVVAEVVVESAAVVAATVAELDVGVVDGESEHAASAKAKTHKTPPKREGPRYDRVEVRGIEPLASTVLLLRSAN